MIIGRYKMGTTSDVFGVQKSKHVVIITVDKADMIDWQQGK